MVTVLDNRPKPRGSASRRNGTSSSKKSNTYWTASDGRTISADRDTLSDFDFSDTSPLTALNCRQDTSINTELKEICHKASQEEFSKSDDDPRRDGRIPCPIFDNYEVDPSSQIVPDVCTTACNLFASPNPTSTYRKHSLQTVDITDNKIRRCHAATKTDAIYHNKEVDVFATLQNQEQQIEFLTEQVRIRETELKEMQLKYQSNSNLTNFMTLKQTTFIQKGITTNNTDSLLLQENCVRSPPPPERSTSEKDSYSTSLVQDLEYNPLQNKLMISKSNATLRSSAKSNVDNKYYEGNVPLASDQPSYPLLAERYDQYVNQDLPKDNNYDEIKQPSSQGMSLLQETKNNDYTTCNLMDKAEHRDIFISSLGHVGNQLASETTSLNSISIPLQSKFHKLDNSFLDSTSNAKSFCEVDFDDDIGSSESQRKQEITDTEREEIISCHANDMMRLKEEFDRERATLELQLRKIEDDYRQKLVEKDHTMELLRDEFLSEKRSMEQNHRAEMMSMIVHRKQHKVGRCSPLPSPILRKLFVKEVQVEHEGERNLQMTEFRQAMEQLKQAHEEERKDWTKKIEELKASETVEIEKMKAEQSKKEQKLIRRIAELEDVIQGLQQNTQSLHLSKKETTSNSFDVELENVIDEQGKNHGVLEEVSEALLWQLRSAQEALNLCQSRVNELEQRIQRRDRVIQQLHGQRRSKMVQKSSKSYVSKVDRKMSYKTRSSCTPIAQRKSSRPRSDCS